MDLVEIHERAEKKKWQKRFIRAAKGYEHRKITDEMFADNVRFFVAKENDDELGFIRINDKTKFFEGRYDGEVWNATDGFVKRPHRNKGVLKFMLKNVIENHNVKMCLLSRDLYSEHSDYYKDLGFEKYTVGKTDLLWLHHNDISHTIDSRNMK